MIGNSTNMDFIVNEIFPFFKNHPILTLGWVAIAFMIIQMTVKMKLSKVKVISNVIAIQMINNQNAAVVDLRNADNFKKGHIAESINILPIDIKNGSTKSIDKYKALPVILVDENDLNTVALGETLSKQGFNHLFALKDGIAGWNGENLPLVTK